MYLDPRTCSALSVLYTHSGTLPACAILYNYESTHLLPVAAVLLLLMIISSSSAIHTNSAEKRMVAEKQPPLILDFKFTCWIPTLSSAVE